MAVLGGAPPLGVVETLGVAALGAVPVTVAAEPAELPRQGELKVPSVPLPQFWTPIEGLPACGCVTPIVGAPQAECCPASRLASRVPAS